MGWLTAHVYLSTLVVVAILLVLGGTFVASRAPAAPSQQSTITWSGGTPVSAYQNYGDYGVTQSPSPQEVAQDVIQNQGPATLSLPPLATSSASTNTPASNSFDYEALLAQLSGSTQTSVSVPSSQGNASAVIAQAYQFIPTGLVATTAPAKKSMTDDQQALYSYGNEVGGEIQSFEELHTNETEVLKDQAEDRTDPTKAAAVVSLGQGLASVGTFMQQMQDVPASITSQHDALAQSYVAIGAKLQLVAQAQSDADFVQAVENYDDSANTFVANYGALAQFFSEQGVVFSSQDPGSVFSFTDTSGGAGL